MIVWSLLIIHLVSGTPKEFPYVLTGTAQACMAEMQYVVDQPKVALGGVIFTQKDIIAYRCVAHPSNKPPENIDLTHLRDDTRVVVLGMSCHNENKYICPSNR